MPKKSLDAALMEYIFLPYLLTSVIFLIGSQLSVLLPFAQSVFESQFLLSCQVITTATTRIDFSFNVLDFSKCFFIVPLLVAFLYLWINLEVSSSVVFVEQTNFWDVCIGLGCLCMKQHFCLSCKNLNPECHDDDVSWANF